MMMKKKKRIIGFIQSAKVRQITRDDDFHDVKKYSEDESKSKLGTGAASTKPEDFDVLLDFKDCFPAPEEKEPVLCNCEPPPQTKIYFTGQKGKNFGRSFHRCSSWITEAPCWRKTCNFFKRV